jgi:hypothetical protein
LKLSRAETEEISYRDFSLKQGAYQFDESREWEKARFLAYIQINSQIPKGKPGVKLEKIMKLPTDEVGQSNISKAMQNLANFIKNG